MIIPVRCFTCSKVIGDLWEAYQRKIKEKKSIKKKEYTIDEITNNLLKNYNNSKIIKMLGDSFMLEFNKVEDAINFSIELNNNKSKNDRILIIKEALNY